MATARILKIPFEPKAIHGIYGVNYYFHKKDTVPQRLQFEATVEYCGQYMDEYSIYHISKKEFVVNRNESDEYLYDIAKKCADIIFPITVLLDQNGHPVLIRTDDIVRRWSEKRTELDRYYKGDTAEYYLNKVEEAVNDPVKMTQLISNDLFFSQLFAFQYHNEANMVEFENDIMLIPFSIPLQFSSMQEIDMDSYSNSKYDTIHIIHRGSTKNPYKYRDFYSSSDMNANQYNATLTAKYCIHCSLGKESKDVEAIEGDFVISKEEDDLNSIKIEAYRLDEKVLEYGFDEEFEKSEREHKRIDNSLMNKLKRYFKT